MSLTNEDRLPGGAEALKGTTKSKGTSTDSTEKITNAGQSTLGKEV
jgi:hypothetical protein